MREFLSIVFIYYFLLFFAIGFFYRSACLPEELKSPPDNQMCIVERKYILMFCRIYQKNRKSFWNSYSFTGNYHVIFLN